MIRLANSNDVVAIAATYDQLFQHERQHGSTSNWQQGVYPSADSAKQAVQAGEMYVLEQQGEIVASMVLNRNQASEYRQMPWRYAADDAEVLVIHTLCIPPQQAGRGWASQMLAFAKDFAQTTQSRVIRLDTYAHNEPAKKLYQKHGFRIVGYADALLQGLIPEKLVFLEYAV